MFISNIYIASDTDLTVYSIDFTMIPGVFGLVSIIGALFAFSGSLNNSQIFPELPQPFYNNKTWCATESEYE